MMENNFNYGYGQSSYQRPQLRQYAFVNGPEGAKAYQMQPNSTMLLMDADNPICYMKTTDALGKGSLRYFKLEEIDEATLLAFTHPQASTANATNAINAIKDGNASLIREFGNVETALTALGGNLQNCCCSIQRNIDQTNYNMAQNTAAIKEAILLDGQKTRELLTTNKMEAMQNRINQLELQNAVAGVVRYPTSSAYSAGANPFCNCGCGCGNI